MATETENLLTIARDELDRERRKNAVLNERIDRLIAQNAAAEHQWAIDQDALSARIQELADQTYETDQQLQNFVAEITTELIEADQENRELRADRQFLSQVLLAIVVYEGDDPNIIRNLAYSAIQNQIPQGEAA